MKFLRFALKFLFTQNRGARRRSEQVHEEQRRVDRAGGREAGAAAGPGAQAAGEVEAAGRARAEAEGMGGELEEASEDAGASLFN